MVLINAGTKLMESGTRLGSYEISDLLGKGGMGEVYRARDTKLGREVAIKVLPAEFAQDAERLARLEREARMLAALNHPNIAAIHGLEESDDTRFLVLELVEGDTLADRLKRGAIPVEESLKLALQIAEALESAHEKGVIHRDLKPANIKVTPDGKLKVLDFGLAKAFVGDQADVNLSNSPTLSMQATQQGVVLGTAAYMSPEQAEGETVDSRADIWAFGVVLFEMLSGLQTFDGKTVARVLAAVLNSEPEWDALPPNLHPRIRALLDRLLEKDHKDRLSGISDARVEIQKVLSDSDGGVRAPAVVSEVGGRVPGYWLAASVVVTALIVGLAAWNLKPTEPVVISRWEHLLPDGQGFRNQGRTILTISPDGSNFVYNGTGGLYLRSMDEREAQLIPGTEGLLTNPTFSPDGEWLAFASTGGLQKIPVVGGAAVTLAQLEGNPLGISWDVDDTIVLGTTVGAMAVSADGGEPELFGDQARSVFAGYPQVLPGGEAVLANIGGGPSANGGDIVLLRASGEPEPLFPGSRARYVSTGHIVYEQGGVLFGVSFDLDGLQVTGGPVPLVEGVQTAPPQFAVSDSGVLVYVRGTGGAAAPDGVLAWVDRAGGRQPLDVPPMQYRQPRLSPDNTQLAVYTVDGGAGGTAFEPGGETNIWIYEVDGSTQIQRMAGAGNNFRPIWTPDGERLTFTSDRDGDEAIWWQPADGSQPAERLTDPETNVQQWPDAWSPDGRTLLFTKLGGEYGQTVWSLSMDDDNAEPEFVAGGQGPEQAGGADFSPDGMWIAYRRNRGGEHIEVQPFPLTGAVYTTALEGGSYPMWSGDGSELFYRRSAAAGGTPEPRLMGVDVAFDGNPRFTNEKTLPTDGMQLFFGNRDYDISADDQRFLVMFPDREVESSAPIRPQINVVLNWFEELKERVPVP